jgi:hypothetical protein
VIFNEFEGEDGTGNHVYLIWSMETFLSAFPTAMILEIHRLIFLRAPSKSHSEPVALIYRFREPQPFGIQPTGRP